MKKSSILSSLLLFAGVMMLSGCLFPYVEDDGRGRHRGGHHDGDHRDDGHRDDGHRNDGHREGGERY